MIRNQTIYDKWTSPYLLSFPALADRQALGRESNADDGWLREQT
jgi:hypothetical protein